MMDIVALDNPGKLVFGPGCFQTFLDDVAGGVHRRIFILSIPPFASFLESSLESLQKKGIETEIFDGIREEPSFSDLERTLELARSFQADGIVGIGGGSVLDTSKLLAALLRGRQSIEEVAGINRLAGRTTYLACLPTTSGTGSEVSPNAIFHEGKSGAKVGVISPFLVPDAAYIDPELTLGLPPRETASTGMDALTHCIEAYTNKFAHPIIDRIALEGIRKIGKSLVTAYKNGADRDARTDLALGSVYGGMCLGPVNTAAVHALSYPLGSLFKVPHGLANALLLPYVMEFNLPACPEKYREIAIALAAGPGTGQNPSAEDGIRMIRQLQAACNMARSLSEFDIHREDLDGMVNSAMQVQRLLKNNPKELTPADARAIYEKALQ